MTLDADTDSPQAPREHHGRRGGRANLGPAVVGGWWDAHPRGPKCHEDGIGVGSPGGAHFLGEQAEGEYYFILFIYFY